MNKYNLYYKKLKKQYNKERNIQKGGILNKIINKL